MMSDGNEGGDGLSLALPGSLISQLPENRGETPFVLITNENRGRTQSCRDLWHITPYWHSRIDIVDDDGIQQSVIIMDALVERPQLEQRGIRRLHFLLSMNGLFFMPPRTLTRVLA